MVGSGMDGSDVGKRHSLGGLGNQQGCLYTAHPLRLAASALLIIGMDEVVAAGDRGMLMLMLQRTWQARQANQAVLSSATSHEELLPFN